jgi:O-antigen ligase
MHTTTTRTLSLNVPMQAAGLLALGAGATLVAWMGDPILVPLAAAALVGGAFLLRWPHVGILLMFAMTLFKPEALQGGLSVNAALAAALVPSLVLDLLVRRRFDLLRSRQFQVYVLLGVVVAVNWYLWGRLEAPSYLSDLDHSTRTLFRFGFHFVFLTFMIAFIRTRGQVLALTGVFLAGVFWTLPGAISRSYSPPVSGSSPEALRAMAVSGVQAAENANRLAFLALMGISLVWFWMRDTRNPLLRIAGMGTVLVLVLTVFLSGSRSGLINLGLLLILLLARVRLKPVHIAGILLLVIAIVAVAALFVPQPILNRITALSGGSDDGRMKGVAESTKGRMVALETALTLFAGSPFVGIGVGNYRWMTALDTTFTGAAHNAYVLTLAEGGILLLGVYLLLFWATFRNLRWAAARAAALPHIRLDWLIQATHVNLILLLAFSLFAEAWKEFYFLLILATAAILTQIYRRGSTDA